MLDQEKAKLMDMQTRLSYCTLSGHQRDITIGITDLGNIAVTEMHRGTGYSAKVIRGREMILLGVKKVLVAMVEQRAAVVADIERQIAEARV
jgi:hypothetical protein